MLDCPPPVYRRELYQELLAFLTGRLRCRHAAADITQESYVRALKAEREGGMADPRAWLFSVARHLVIDAVRHRRTEEAWAAERSALPGAFMPSSEFVAAQRQVVERVEAVLAALPARRRDVFVMFRVYGHSRAEIALALNITEAAVAKHVVRATVDCAAVLAEAQAAMPDGEWLSAPGARHAIGEPAWQT